jgi:hypothetical protein
MYWLMAICQLCPHRGWTDTLFVPQMWYFIGFWKSLVPLGRGIIEANHCLPECVTRLQPEPHFPKMPTA